MWSILIATILAILFSFATTYDCVNIHPIVLTIANGTLTTGIPNSRGVAFQFDPSEQVVSLRSTFIWNNTRIRNSIDCHGNSSEVAACVGASGSVFNTSLSDFHPEIGKNWSDRVLTTDPPPIGHTPFQGYAQGHLDGGQQLDLPLEIWTSSSSTNRSFLALGPKSSFLYTLLQNGQIPSNFTQYYHGSRSYSNYSDGEIVLGGWNAARVNGSFVDYPMGALRMPIPCALVVRVQSFDLVNENGSHPLIPRNSGGKLACIDPLANAFVLDNAMWATWINVTNRPPSPRGPSDIQTYPREMEPILGTLSIELEGGYSSVIPHYELINPDRGAILNDNGEYGVYQNDSRIQAAVSTGPSDFGDDVLILSGVFLSNTVLTVDHDRNIFSLAPATPDSTVGELDIRTVCSKDQSVHPPVSTLGPGTAKSSGLSDSDKIQIGLGVGIGIAALIATCIGAYYAWRAYRHSRHSELVVVGPGTRMGSVISAVSPIAEEEKKKKMQHREIRFDSTASGVDNITLVEKSSTS
jgi:hypothetical protein